jgi:hypothetical protein
MTASSRTAPYPDSLTSLALGSNDLPVPSFAPKTVMLDFAANPNHYRVSGNGKVKKSKPAQDPRLDRSPRLQLSLTVQCGTVQEKDDGVEWWLSVMR